MAHQITPQPTYQTGICPYCDPSSEQQLLFSLQGDRTSDYTSLSLFGCDCRRILLYETCCPASSEIVGKEFMEYSELLWPVRDALSVEVPESVRALYAGALKVKSHPDSFVVQLRRTIEAMCVTLGARNYDQDGKPIDLMAMLRELSHKGVLPPQVADVLHQIRYLGNVGAHGVDETVDPSAAQILDELFRLLVQYIYTIPHKLDKLREETQTLKLKTQGKRHKS